MKSQVELGSSVAFNVDRAASLVEEIRHIGIVDADVLGPDGEVKWSHRTENKITDQGLAYLLNRGFFAEASCPFAAVNTAGSNGPGWYVGLMATTPTTSDTDDPSSTLNSGSPPWTEFANYATTSKQRYDNQITELETRASQTITSRATGLLNDVAVVSISITAGASVPVGGIFLVNVSNATYDNATTILFSTAVFSPEPSVSSGDTIRITYTHRFGASTT